MILILRKDKYVLGRNDIFFGIWGEAGLFFRDLGSKGKILLGSRGNYFQGSGEINALFSGIKGAQTPPGGPHLLLLFFVGPFTVRSICEVESLCF